ncbi:hypothetical protein BKA81DRAFT_430738 [Phyllosticta paracitricarpa]
MDQDRSSPTPTSPLPSEYSTNPDASRLILTHSTPPSPDLSTELYSRFIVTGTPGLDDLFIILAIIFLIPQTFAMMMQVESGWGEHAYLLTLYQLNRNQMYRYQFIILDFIVAFFTKLSICWLVLRMTAGATTFGRQYRLIIKIIM